MLSSIANRTTKRCGVAAVWLKAGSRFDTKPGVAHFLEHLVLRNMSPSVCEKGVLISGFTTREEICFFASGKFPTYQKFSSTLKNLLMLDKVSQCDFDNEKEQIMAEMREVLKDKRDYLVENMHKLVYPDEQFSHPILGRETDVRNMTLKDIFDFRKNVLEVSRKVYIDTSRPFNSDVVLNGGQSIEKLSALDPFVRGAKQKLKWEGRDESGPNIAIAFGGISLRDSCAEDILALMHNHQTNIIKNQNEGFTLQRIESISSIHSDKGFVGLSARMPKSMNEEEAAAILRDRIRLFSQEFLVKRKEARQNFKFNLLQSSTDGMLISDERAKLFLHQIPKRSVPTNRQLRVQFQKIFSQPPSILRLED
eukprot:GHVP01000266.1.p1 GENE.GHVP01000266.1~~GHVP01000266.1.p1  ORF type:complete len:366 (+),score=57.61 GHVP01000266.1:625-1722(+)